METRMRMGRMLLWICAAAALGACSPGDSGDQAGHDTTPSPVTASDQSDSPDQEHQKPAPFSLRLTSDVPPAMRETVRAFLAFAADPRVSTGAKVLFASPLLLGVNDADRVVLSNDVQKPSAWFVSDGEGTTSALFVISNSIANSKDGTVQFLASTRQIPLCNLDQDGKEETQDESLYVTLEPHSGCADGFRLRLDVDSSATIRAVELAVRAP